jgi:hypothetical protein
MSTPKHHQDHEADSKVSSRSQPIKVTTAFEMPVARNIDVDTASMARGMQEWFDSFNKSQKMEADEDETAL